MKNDGESWDYTNPNLGKIHLMLKFILLSIFLLFIFKLELDNILVWVFSLIERVEYVFLLLGLGLGVGFRVMIRFRVQMRLKLELGGGVCSHASTHAFIYTNRRHNTSFHLLTRNLPG